MSADDLSRADLGGQPGNGRVRPEPEGELWHADWAQWRTRSASVEVGMLYFSKTFLASACSM